MICGKADSFKQHSWKRFFSAMLRLHINNLCFPAICIGQSIIRAVKRAAYINSRFFRTQAFEPTLFARVYLVIKAGKEVFFRVMYIPSTWFIESWLLCLHGVNSQLQPCFTTDLSVLQCHDSWQSAGGVHSWRNTINVKSIEMFTRCFLLPSCFTDNKLCIWSVSGSLCGISISLFIICLLTQL